MPNEWHLLTTNKTVDLKIDKSRLPYMVNSLEVDAINAIKVMFVSNHKNFTVGSDEIELNNKLDKLGTLLYSGMYSKISLNTPFKLSISGNNDVEELLMIVNCEFESDLPPL